VKWITREHPKIDRVACPWLIARFIDRDAEFLFAPPDRVFAEAEQLGATPYDIDGTLLSHRGAECTFDAFLSDYAIADPALHELAVIVRGADTGHLDLSPQSPGLLAISLGLSRLCVDSDARMLHYGFVVYDALYEWLRYGKAEQHGWNPGRVGGTGEPAWDRLISGGVEIQVSSRTARVKGRRVVLRPREFALLVALVARAGRVLTRDVLMRHVWAYEPDVSSRTVDTHVAALRRRLGSARASLRTLRGKGYVWEP
jgi:hypothetical protein